MPRIIPEPRYFSMPSMEVGAEVRMNRDDETNYALHLMQQIQEHGADWITGAQLNINGGQYM